MTDLTEAQRDLIERFGVLHDRIGVRPAAGRILGLLLVSPDPELTFDQIRETLGLSKSATSTALTHLQTIGSVEYRTRPGDRKRYFRKDFVDWEASFLSRLDEYLAIRDLLTRALELGEDRPEAPRQAMERMIGFLELLETEIHDAHRRWEAGGAKLGVAAVSGDER